MINTELMKVTSLIEGKPVTQEQEKTMEVINSFSGEVVGKVSLASREDAEKAIESAHRVFHKTMKKMPAYRRAEILSKAADCAAQAMAKLAQNVGIPTSLKDVGVAAEDISNLAEEASKIDRLLNNNPRWLTVKEIKKVYEEAYGTAEVPSLATT
ncbi:aldehyde dehydrogenase family protein [Priestia filamentosa]|uniref:aldehyde dehydrogenase family protein n=1 Tax=Priestia filamentosa TaxID=1402861 RepID=UPI001C1E35EC|nr:aldehyde dehydrogenase family protein [Priestia filamentosa]WCM14097.1 aldehyde dehydrogenase family protein [Priestia filamentosa]